MFEAYLLMPVALTFLKKIVWFFLLPFVVMSPRREFARSAMSAVSTYRMWCTSKTLDMHIGS